MTIAYTPGCPGDEFEDARKYTMFLLYDAAAAAYALIIAAQYFLIKFIFASRAVPLHSTHYVFPEILHQWKQLFIGVTFHPMNMRIVTLSLGVSIY